MERIKGSPADFDGEELILQVSMGVASSQSTATGVYEFEALVDLADKAMYAAKAAVTAQVRAYRE